MYESSLCFLPSSKSIGHSEQNIDIQAGGHCGHLGFPIETRLAIFDLQVTLLLPTKFQFD